jgi:ArsR family transcriptional regulator, arsenate/arsenite/antimonite-responsive transcriptional repressor
MDRSPGAEAPLVVETQGAEDGRPCDEIVHNLVEIFKLLSDETRLRIVFLLQQRHELNVRTLCQILRQSQPAVSHHLALLRVAGLIEMRRDGKHNYYRLLTHRFEESVRTVAESLTGGQCIVRWEDAATGDDAL